MAQNINEQGQPVGEALPDWRGCAVPSREPMAGIFCDVVALDPSDHAHDLFDAYRRDKSGALWTYMSVGPFSRPDEFRAWAESAAAGTDPLFFAIVDKSTGCAVGIASLLRIQPSHGVIEVGFIAFSPALQRSTAATEAMYLMMRRVFAEHGYRRYEWKCDALNAASGRAAERLGFTFDGIFEQAIVYKGRNRDTAWYSILDRDWPALELAYQEWLGPENFDAEGQQKTRLSELISRHRG